MLERHFWNGLEQAFQGSVAFTGPSEEATCRPEDNRAGWISIRGTDYR